MKCSFACASWARMSSARIPPAAKNTRDVQMHRIPIRLWSVVVTQLMTRPWRQSGRYGSTVALAATRRPLVDASLQIGEQRQHLLIRPAVRDRWHLVSALADQLLEALSLREQGIVRDLRPEAALSLEPVALR